MFFFLLFSCFIQSRVLYRQLTLWQLIQPDLESRFIVRSQLGPIVQSGSFPSAGLQVVTQSTHLSKDCYPQLVSNPHRSEIRASKVAGLHVMLGVITKHDFSSFIKELKEGSEVGRSEEDFVRGPVKGQKHDLLID